MKRTRWRLSKGENDWIDAYVNDELSVVSWAKGKTKRHENAITSFIRHRMSSNWQGYGLNECLEYLESWFAL